MFSSMHPATLLRIVLILIFAVLIVSSLRGKLNLELRTVCIRITRARELKLQTNIYILHTEDVSTQGRRGNCEPYRFSLTP